VPLRRIAELDLPKRNVSHRTLTFSADGNQLLIGTNSFEGPTETLGVMWVGWAASSPAIRTLDFPAQSFVADIDSSVLALDVDVDGAHAIAIVGSYSAYRAPEEQLWLIGKDAPRLLHHSRNARLAFCLTANRKQLCFLNSQREPPCLELVPLVPLAPPIPLPLRSIEGAQAVAVSTERKYVAIAHEFRVACSTLEGGEVCAWPKGAPVNALHFAEDDLAVWAIRKEEIMLLQWKGEQVAFSVPKMQALGLHVADRTAMFVGGREVCELDLSSGARRATGTLPGASSNIACDPARRRIAVLAYVDGRARISVFELTR
jgi:hypothetical protein